MNPRRQDLYSILGGPALILPAFSSLGPRTAGGFSEDQSDVKRVIEQTRKGNLICQAPPWLGVIHAGSELSLQISHGAESVSQPGDGRP